VVLQLEGGGLCVGLCFEEGAPGACALWECGGEKGGERVREELVDFGCVQDWLGMGRKRLSRELVFWLREGGTNLEGVIEDEYDYAVCVIRRA
jgi:hypothetical protein